MYLLALQLLEQCLKPAVKRKSVMQIAEGRKSSINNQDTCEYETRLVIQDNKCT